MRSHSDRGSKPFVAGNDLNLLKPLPIGYWAWVASLESIGKILLVYQNPDSRQYFYDIKFTKPHLAVGLNTENRRVSEHVINAIFNLEHPDFDPTLLPRKARRRIIEYMRGV